MIYTQMLFALAMDKLVFGHSPELLSLLGSTLILGSAICVAVKKAGPQNKAKEGAIAGNEDEERGLMQEIDGSDNDTTESVSIVMRETANGHLNSR
jgi:hypothetical protein